MQKKMKKTNKKGKASSKNIPAAKPRTTRTSAPLVRSISDGKVVVRHREFLGDITNRVFFGSGLISPSVAINPGMSGSFPWLSNIANNYEFYQFKALTFEYHPICGTTVGGSVMMGIDYDALDAPPSNKQRMMSYMGAVQGPPYSPMKVGTGPASLNRFGAQRYTRPGPVPVGSDRKTYDLGVLYVMTDGGAGTATGSLYASYEVILSTPHSPASFPWEDSAVVSTVTNSKASPFLGAVVTNADPVDPVSVVLDNTQLTLKAGEYIASLDLSGTGLTSIPINSAFTSAINGFTSTNVGLGGVANAGGTAYGGKTIFNIPSGGNVTFTVPGAWTTLTSLGLRLAPYLTSLG